MITPSLQRGQYFGTFIARLGGLLYLVDRLGVGTGILGTIIANEEDCLDKYTVPSRWGGLVRSLGTDGESSVD